MGVDGTIRNLEKAVAVRNCLLERFSGKFRRCWKIILRFSGSAKGYPCQGLGTFRQGKWLLENWPRLRERCWTFSSETATAFLSSSESGGRGCLREGRLGVPVKSGRSGFCRLLLHFLGTFAVQHMFWVLPKDYCKKDPCNFNTEMFVSKVMFNSWSTSSQPNFVRAFVSRKNSTKNRQGIFLCAELRKGWSTLGQLLANSPSHGKLQGSSLQ